MVRLHYLSLPVAFAGLLWYTRRQYFTGDDWEFIHRVIPGVGNLGMFAPHNEHWSTLPLTAYKVLFAVVGVRSYIPYLAVLLAVHVLAAHLLWRIMLRAGADALVATAIASLFMVLGAGAENISWAFQIGFVGALAAGLGMVLAMLENTPRRLALGWLLGVVSVMCSGLGPVMVAAAAFTVLLKFGWRRAFLTAVVPAAVYVVWWVMVGRHITSPPLPRGSLADVPDYMFTGMTSAAAGITGLRFVGALLLLPLAWWVITRARRSSDQAAIMALAATTLLFFFVVGLGRVGLGVEESKTSRYVYITAVLLLPAAAVAASQLIRRQVVAAAIVALAVAWAGVHNLHALQLNVQGLTGPRQHAEARIILASHLVADGATIFRGQPESATSPDLTTSDVVYLVQNHDLPDDSPIPPDAFDIVSVAANIQMTSSPSPLLSGGAVVLTPRTGATLMPGSPTCIQAGVITPGAPAAVRLVFSSPASVLIRATSGSLITVRLVATPSSKVESPPHPFPFDASGAMYLNVSLAGSAAIVDVPSSGATFCGVIP